MQKRRRAYGSKPIADPRQASLLDWLAALPPLPRARPRKSRFKLSTWLEHMASRTDVVRHSAPAALPPALPFMVESVASLACYSAQSGWQHDADTRHGMLAAAVLQQAWADACWLEHGAQGEAPRTNSDAARKRRAKADHRLSGIMLFLGPAAPSAWGWSPTLEGWCDVLGLHVERVRSTVEAHLRALSPEHALLCDYVRCDIERAAPQRFWNRNDGARKRITIHMQEAA